MDKDSDINATSAKEDFLEGLKTTRAAIELRLDDMVNAALMSESIVLDCFDMDRTYMNSALCEISHLISEETKRRNAGLSGLHSYKELDGMIGFQIRRAINRDLREAAEDSI